MSKSPTEETIDQKFARAFANLVFQDIDSRHTEVKANVLQKNLLGAFLRQPSSEGLLPSLVCKCLEGIVGTGEQEEYSNDDDQVLYDFYLENLDEIKKHLLEKIKISQEIGNANKKILANVVAEAFDKLQDINTRDPEISPSKISYDENSLTKTGKIIRLGNQGNLYIGDAIKDDCEAHKANGTGILIFANGDRYEGDFTNGHMSGKGSYAYANGDLYNGEFIDGRRNGQGVYTFKNGNKVTGDFVNGKRVSNSASTSESNTELSPNTVTSSSSVKKFDDQSTNKNQSTIST